MNPIYFYEGHPTYLIASGYDASLRRAYLVAILDGFVVRFIAGDAGFAGLEYRATL